MREGIRHPPWEEKIKVARKIVTGTITSVNQVLGTPQTLFPTRNNNLAVIIMMKKMKNANKL